MDFRTNFINYIQVTKNVSAKTVIAYSCDLKQFLAFEGNVLKPDLCRFVAHLTSDLHLKETTILRKIMTLKLFYGYLVDTDVLPVSPFVKLKFRFKKEKKLPKTLTVAEVARLLNCFNVDVAGLTPFGKFIYMRDSALIDLLISTGIRVGEAAAITADDVISCEHTILINGKGRKQRLIYISSPVTWGRICALLKERKKSPERHLFLNRYGLPITPHGIEDIYKKYAVMAHVNNRSTPHYLRHTFATNLLANGADLRSVQEILGHASVSTTQIYTEVTTNRKKQVLKKYNYRNKLI